MRARHLCDSPTGTGPRSTVDDRAEAARQKAFRNVRSGVAAVITAGSIWTYTAVALFAFSLASWMGGPLEACMVALLWMAGLIGWVFRASRPETDEPSERPTMRGGEGEGEGGDASAAGPTAVATDEAAR